MDEIRAILAAMYREEITSEEAEKQIAALGEEATSEFIVEAFNCQWINRVNLGIDEDGNVL